jgi:hypothetical protein
MLLLSLTEIIHLNSKQNDPNDVESIKVSVPDYDTDMVSTMRNMSHAMSCAAHLIDVEFSELDIDIDITGCIDYLDIAIEATLHPSSSQRLDVFRDTLVVLRNNIVRTLES